MLTVPLLTMKPVIYVANISEDEIGSDMSGNAGYVKLAARAAEEGAGILPICAQIEAEIAVLEPDEKAVFLEDLGLAESGLDRLIKASYSLLGLISFLTAGSQEVRAWTITRGTRAPQAAGKIHSDFERGFIRAEIIAFDKLMECGSMTVAKEKGLVRSEGLCHAGRRCDPLPLQCLIFDDQGKAVPPIIFNAKTCMPRISDISEACRSFYFSAVMSRILYYQDVIATQRSCLSALRLSVSDAPAHQRCNGAHSTPIFYEI